MGAGEEDDVRRLEDPEATLERAFIDEFLRSRGHDWAGVRALPEARRKHLLEEASTYAASKLTEVEARAHYVHHLHGEE
jgi:hypothetical protein